MVGAVAVAGASDANAYHHIRASMIINHLLFDSLQCDKERERQAHRQTDRRWEFSIFRFCAAAAKSVGPNRFY